MGWGGWWGAGPVDGGAGGVGVGEGEGELVGSAFVAAEGGGWWWWRVLVCFDGFLDAGDEDGVGAGFDEDGCAVGEELALVAVKRTGWRRLWYQ